MADKAAFALVVCPDLRFCLEMKHAGANALERLKPLLQELRKRDGLKEKSLGVFYRSGRAFLHFHEHGPNECFADVRFMGDTFQRFPATSVAHRKKLLRSVDAGLRDAKLSRTRKSP